MNITDESQKTLQEKLHLFRTLSGSQSYKKARSALSLFVLGVVAISSLYFANRTKQTPQPQNSSAQTLQSVRFMNVYYIPSNSNYAGKTTYLKNLRDGVRMLLGYASAYHHDLNKQVVQFDEVGPLYTRNEQRPHIDGSTDEVRKQKTLTAILNDTQNNAESICSVVNRMHLDEVWLWFDPTVDDAPGEEFVIMNNTSSYGARYPADTCPNGTQTFVVMAFDYHAPAQNAVHSFGHYLETLLDNMQGDDMFVGRFMGAAYYPNDTVYGIPKDPYILSERCGTVHTPPNIPLDKTTGRYAGYDYTNANQITNNKCWNWTPDGSGTATSVSAQTWIGMPTPQLPSGLITNNGENYYLWWMQNMPHSSNQVYFNGKKIPTWWDFVANTDAQIIKYQSDSTYWMNPDLWPPVAATKTAVCTGTSGYYSSCTYTPGSTVLGTHTENNQVLAATTYDNIALVTVAYGTNNPISVSNITFCGDAMTRVGAGPSNGGGMKTEMWYRLAPKSGVCPVTVRFSADPGQRIVTTTIFNNIDQVNPVGANTTGGFSGPYTATPGSISATLTGPKDSLMVCTYALYSEQSNPPSANNATANPGTLQLWKFEQPKFDTGQIANVWAGIGGGVQRVNDNQSTTLSWKTVKQQPQSYTCANLNVKPFTIPLTTPAPIPTPIPSISPTSTPTPTTVPTPTATPLSYLLVPKDQITAVATSYHVGYEPQKALDTNTSTIWHSEWSPLAALPQQITMTLPNIYKVGKIGYLPRQDAVNGTITGYKVLVSTNGTSTTTVATGTWADDTTLKSVTFTPVDAKYVSLVVTSGHGGYASASELAVWYVGTPSTPVPTPVPTATPTSTTSYFQIAPSQLSAVGSSQHVGYESAKVTDNNTATFWNSEWSPYDPAPQSIKIALGGLFPVSKIIYTPRQDGSPVGNITSYKVSVSNNGVTYSPVATGTWADDQTPKTAAFFPTFSNYVKLEAIKGNSGYASASEISIWQTPINLSYSSTATATSQHVGYEAYRATDTNVATFWHSEWNPYSALPQSLVLNLGKQFTVKGIVYMPRQDGALAGTITAYKIYTSLDGTNYQLAYTGTWPDDSVYKTVMFTPVNASYVKIQVDGGDGSYASAALLAIIY